MKLTGIQKNALKLCEAVLGTILGIVLLVSCARYIAPLLVALVMYYISKPLSRFLQTKLKFGGSIAAAVTTVVLLALIVALATFIALRTISEIQQVILNFIANSDEISKAVTDGFQLIEDNLGLLHPKVSDALESALMSTISRASSFVSSIATRTVRIVFSLPQAIVFVIASSVCAFMLIKDNSRIHAFFDRNVPENYMKNFQTLKQGLFTALFGYIKAQLIMCCITFTELITAFTILGQSYALLLALIIAIIDALPLFGCGLFLIPWTIYSFVVGDIKYGIGLGILYICTLSIRQMVEPRVLGRNIGVYPMLTLLSMYAGLQVWGVAGLFLGPLTVLTIKGVLEFVLKGRTMKQYVRGESAPVLPDAAGTK